MFSIMRALKRARSSCFSTPEPLALSGLNQTGLTTTEKPGRRRRDAGFSLLEIMVVVVIISILALVIAPRIIDRPDQARVARAKSDIGSLQSALMLYKLDNYQYPTTEQGIAALVEAPTVAPIPPNYAAKGYIGNIPIDPWGRPYQYLSPGVNDEFDVFTFGADGVRGGEGVNSDIGNWNMK